METLSLMIWCGLTVIAGTAFTINQGCQSLINQNYETLDKVTEYGSIAALPFATAALVVLL